MTSSSRSNAGRGRGSILPRTTICALLILILASCVQPIPTTQAPPQSIDLTMAKSLLVVQTIIEGDPKTVPPTTGLRDLAASHPASKASINQVIAGYNLAETAYRSFHADLIAGKNPDPTEISARIEGILQQAQALIASLK